MPIGYETKASEALRWAKRQRGIMHDGDGIWPGQCADWIIIFGKKYFDWHFEGHAKDIISQKNRRKAPKGRKFIRNKETFVVQPLDICVWVKGKCGHVALGVEGNLDLFKPLDQNWTTHGNGSPVEEVIHNYDDLEFWGVIRLPFIDDLDIEKDSYVKTTKGNGKMVKKYIGDWNGVPTYTEFLKIGTRRTGQRLDSGHPKFLVFHDTGNRNSTAQQNVNYYNNTYNQPWATTVSAHVFVDDKECINCVPLDEKA